MSTKVTISDRDWALYLAEAVQQVTYWHHDDYVFDDCGTCRRARQLVTEFLDSRHEGWTLAKTVEQKAHYRCRYCGQTWSESDAVPTCQALICPKRPCERA